MITRNGLKKHIRWEEFGFSTVETAESGNQALLYCQKEKPDLVVSDIKMRGMNGIETCKI